MAAFDVEGARKAGYTDAEITDHLASQKKYNLKQARSAGYTDSEILAHLAGTPQPAPALIARDTPGIAETIVLGAGKKWGDIIDGIAQIAGDEKSNQGLNELRAEEARTYKPLQDARPVLTAVGEGIPALAVPGPGKGTALASMGRMALQGAVPELLSHGDVSERAGRAALSGGLSVAGGTLIPKALGLAKEGATRVGQGTVDAMREFLAKADPNIQAIYQKATALGIPVSVSQLSDSRWVKNIAAATKHLPFSGAIDTAKEAAESFTRAVSKTFGDDTPNITKEVYNSNKQRLGKEFDRLTSQNEFHIDKKFLGQVKGLLDDTSVLADGTHETVDGLVAKLMSKVDITKGQKVSGETYQNLDTLMSKIVKGGGTQAEFVGRLRDIMRNQMDDSISVADQEAWKTARSQYRNLKAVRDIVAREGTDGLIPPSKLAHALNNSEAGKEAMAMGTRGQLGDVSQVGTKFLQDYIPNSGTAERTMALSALTGGMGGAGMMGADPSGLGALALAGVTTARGANSLLNKPVNIPRGSSGVTFADLVRGAPGRNTEILGGYAGRTYADLMENR